jgi:uncharacterized protein YggE
VLGADNGLKATVTASGSAEVLPTELHVVLTFKQKAADAKAALAALKTAHDGALAKLPGIDPAKARDETPTVLEKGGGSAAQVMAMARGNRLKKKSNDEPQEVLMQQVVRIPVALSGKDLLAITVEAEGMKAAVHTAKAMPDMPDDADDAEGMNYAAMIGAAQKQRGPVEFEFVAPRTPELEQKAYAAALKNAHAKASALAAAAGLKGARVVSVVVQEPEKEGPEGAMSNYVRLMMGMLSTPAKTTDMVNGETPALSVKASLVVEFMLE